MDSTVWWAPLPGPLRHRGWQNRRAGPREAAIRGQVSSIASESHRLETHNSQGQTRTARQVYRMMFSGCALRHPRGMCAGMLPEERGALRTI